ncbi:MAG TPA: thioredoxin family protein [Methylocystis sp.]|nr:thioredoxin family protein [Methylocystis sp.]
MISRRLVTAALLLATAAPAAVAAERTPYSPQAFASAQASGASILVEIFAPWCPICRAQQEILTKLEAQQKFKTLKIYRVDFDNQKDAVRTFGASRQSTLIVFKGKDERDRSVGDTNADSLAALLDKAL